VRAIVIFVAHLPVCLSTAAPMNEPPPGPRDLGWPDDGQAPGHAPHEVEHACWGDGCGGHGGIEPRPLGARSLRPDPPA